MTLSRMVSLSRDTISVRIRVMQSPTSPISYFLLGVARVAQTPIMKQTVRITLASITLATCMALSGCATTMSGVAARDLKSNIRQIHLGMPAQQLISLIGRPDRMNRTLTANGITEQWVYSESSFYTPAQTFLAGMAEGNGTPFQKCALYIYINNGKVTSFQTSQ